MKTFIIVLIAFFGGLKISSADSINVYIQSGDTALVIQQVILHKYKAPDNTTFSPEELKQLFETESLDIKKEEASRLTSVFPYFNVTQTLHTRRYQADHRKNEISSFIKETKNREHLQLIPSILFLVLPLFFSVYFAIKTEKNKFKRPYLFMLWGVIGGFIYLYFNQAILLAVGKLMIVVITILWAIPSLWLLKKAEKNIYRTAYSCVVMCCLPVAFLVYNILLENGFSGTLSSDAIEMLNGSQILLHYFIFIMSCCGLILLIRWIKNLVTRKKLTHIGQVIEEVNM